ncbi:MAG: TIGR01906 family membrane protein [Erysipelotrichaceae bacterium]|nr:TIGR01906 family membrane protein [Erysipelotrichaceae bacterium]
MKKSKTLAVVMIITTALFILSLSIALPILFRPFYYWHINILKLPQETGFTYDQIKTAYDEMLDFCLGLRSVFSTGVLRFSESGMLHFVDVRGLFLLDLAVLIVSSLIIILTRLLKKKAVVEPHRFYGHTPEYYGAELLAVVFIMITLLSLGNFDRTFVIFHKIFFPGKTNWLFNPYEDEIINVLPEVFFRNCAIAIVVILIGLCTYFIIRDQNTRRREILSA